METVEQFTYNSRDAWELARRTLGIGSSDAPAILGLSRYKTAFALYHEKLGLQLPTKAEADQVRWGNILEEPIAQRYALETGRTVRNPRASEGDFFLERSRLNPFMVASVDRYTIDTTKPAVGEPTLQQLEEGVLEVKNAHYFMGEDWLDLQEPPAEFQVQVQHQMAVTGRKWGSVACLIGGCSFVWKDIARDEEFIELLTEKEREFWGRLVNRTPPPVDGTEQTRALIGKLHPRDTGNVIELPPETQDLLGELSRLKETDKAMAVRRNEIEGTLKLLIGDNSAGTLRDGSTVTWKWQKRAGHTVKESEFRVLRINEKKAIGAVAST